MRPLPFLRGETADLSCSTTANLWNFLFDLDVFSAEKGSVLDRKLPIAATLMYNMYNRNQISVVPVDGVVRSTHLYRRLNSALGGEKAAHRSRADFAKIPIINNQNEGVPDDDRGGQFRVEVFSSKE